MLSASLSSRAIQRNQQKNQTKTLRALPSGLLIEEIPLSSTETNLGNFSGDWVELILLETLLPEKELQIIKRTKKKQQQLKLIHQFQTGIG